MNPWDLVKAQLQNSLSTESFQNWVNRTQFLELRDSTLYVLAPDQQTREWMESEYGERVRACLISLAIPARTVVYEIRANGRPVQVTSNLEESLEADLDSTLSNLNPKFTFDSFVVGACNQFAHAAARIGGHQSFAQLQPAVHLWRRGDGQNASDARHRPGADRSTASMRIIYTTSERFTNEVVTGIQHRAHAAIARSATARPMFC